MGKPWWEQAGIKNPPEDYKRYPAKYSADGRDRTTIAEVLDKVEMAMNESGDRVACEVIDEEFLWGCWGHKIDHLVELAPDTIDFLRNVRGLVIAALKRGGKGC